MFTHIEFVVCIMVWVNVAYPSYHGLQCIECTFASIVVALPRSHDNACMCTMNGYPRYYDARDMITHGM